MDLLFSLIIFLFYLQISIEGENNNFQTYKDTNKDIRKRKCIHIKYVNLHFDTIHI